jgi:hypothetical protein
MSEPLLVSPEVFKWALTLITGLVAGTWLVYDALKLFWLRKQDGSDPVIHDKRFGYGCGVIIGIIGVTGCLRFHGVI